jgi:hypothetical protein
MQIFDYESSAKLNDLKIVLTRAEAEDLAAYLGAMLERPHLSAVHLTEVTDGRLQREVCFELDGEPRKSA